MLYPSMLSRTLCWKIAYLGLGFATVMSFSGYLTSMMEEMMIKDEVFAKHSAFMEKIAVHQNRVILKYLYSITPKAKGY